ncbi:lipopolysaccharide biosynthesis protein [Vibrio maerlii]|uniref:lipopolysaccharide biosynthesis protein n=1 Tax=Vibrio maerlii TaxID=2231648 RepID=UPI000E3B82C3|nr:oligosaccharide flippase family protein [Vibrio maerlii]
MKLSALKDIASYGFAICIMKGTSLLMLPIITRYLSPEDYGQLELITVSSTFISLIISCSLHEALYRFANDGEDKKTCAKQKANQLFSLSLLTSTALITLLIIAFGLLDMWGNSLPYHIESQQIAIVLLSLIISGSLAIGMAWMRMQDHVTAFTKLSIFTTLFQALLVITLLECNYGVTSMLLAGLVTHIVQWIWVYKLSNLKLVVPTSRFSIKSMRYAIPMTASAVVAFGLNGAERWLVLSSSDLETLGQYAIAAKFALATCILVQPFGMWWMPKRFAILQQDKRNAAFISTLGVMYVCALIIVVGSLSQFALPILLDAQYQQTSLFILGALFMVLGKEVTELVNLGLLVKQRTQELFKINLITTIVGLCCCALLISYGIWGVMISIGCAQLGKTIWVYHTSQACIPIFKSSKPFIFSISITLVCLSGLYFAPSVLEAHTNSAVAMIGVTSVSLTLLLLAIYHLFKENQLVSHFENQHSRCC